MRRFRRCLDALGLSAGGAGAGRRVLNGFFARTFDLWQRVGYHVTPVHFGQPIPDTRTLESQLWQRQSKLIGIELDAAAQVALVRRFADRFRAEYEEFPMDGTDADSDYYVNNRMFESVDGEILYCMLRDLRPRRYLEIGSGFSTLLALKAAERNRAEGHTLAVTAVEPHPGEQLLARRTRLERLIVRDVQTVPIEEFTSLDRGDVLFIDSSHVLRIGSDVQYEVLEILPRLRPGVVVHFHDVFLPSEYPREWLLERHYFWNEQYLLQAFLTFNDCFEVMWAAHWMSLIHPHELAAAFSSFTPGETQPGSLWLRRLK